MDTRHRRELLTRDLATACLAVMGCKDVYPASQGAVLDRARRVVGNCVLMGLIQNNLDHLEELEAILTATHNAVVSLD